MENNNLESIIRNLGSTYDELKAKKIINTEKPTELYIDSDTLEIELSENVELVFSPEKLRLEMIYIRLRKEESGRSALDLPDYLSLLKNKAAVQHELGRPIYSKNTLELHATELYGWDTYQLKGSLHPEALLDIQYNKSMEVVYLIISVMDKNI